MALLAATADAEPSAALSALLQSGAAQTEQPDERGVRGNDADSDRNPDVVLPATAWPASYKPIQRIKFESIEQVLSIMKPHSEAGEPLIIEQSEVLDVEKWADMKHIVNLFSNRKVVVKRSPNCKFRYFDLKKNTGKYVFRQPLTETSETVEDFMREAQKIITEGRPERLYLQETLSGHDQMAGEFASWKWGLVVRVCQACGWGLPDTNELFIGMRGAETPLHFDERENLFFHVRGSKEVVVFPFVDYTSMYPFPTTHPCDRQSMVGTPRYPNLDAFPKFSRSRGQHAVLKGGDLLYLPYGWWHWLRNLDNFAVSISFWSKTPSADLSNGIPDTFSEHMMTRVRRNLETMVATTVGFESQDQAMLDIKDAILKRDQENPLLEQVRRLLAAVRMPLERQDEFLLEMLEGRFGIDWNLHVGG